LYVVMLKTILRDTTIILFLKIILSVAGQHLYLVWMSD
jgi:hypothetical protein